MINIDKYSKILQIKPLAILERNHFRSCYKCVNRKRSTLMKFSLWSWQKLYMERRQFLSDKAKYVSACFEVFLFRWKTCWSQNETITKLYFSISYSIVYYRSKILLLLSLALELFIDQIGSNINLNTVSQILYTLFHILSCP